MNRVLFIFSFLLIIVLFFYLHTLATSDNNFYFTIDQGKDAVLVREILNKRFILKGASTSIEGIHTGFLWPYFLAVGHALFQGHPYGGVFLMNILCLLFLTLTIFWLNKKIGRLKAILVAIGLLFFWRFFETSLWTFNPFPLIILSILQVFLLTEFIATRLSRFYLLALLPVLLAFHAEVAAATSLLLFHLLVGAWAVKKSRLRKTLYLATLIVPALAASVLIKELITTFAKSKTLYQGTSSGLETFARTNFIPMAKEYINIIAQSVLPNQAIIGLLIFLIVAFLFFKKRKSAHPKITVFLTLVGILFTLSYLFFGSNLGWRDWHTLYLYPLVFISFLIMLFHLPKVLASALFLVIFVGHFSYFTSRFRTYPHPPDDRSILRNELTIMDWIYKNSEGDGFNLYTYTDTFFDYHYQYLFWWYGKTSYSFVPCEYSNYPLSPKHTYIPNYLSYSKPTLGCDKWSFIIIESPTNAQSNANWLEEFKEKTTLVAKFQLGKTIVEKRQYK